MKKNSVFHVAVLWHQRHSTGDSTDLTQGRFAPLYRALQSTGMTVHPVVYSDENRDQVFLHLNQMDAVLVWVNPIENGQTRVLLNSLLRRLSTNGVFVSAHPDTIDTLGSKSVLVTTREMSWGSDTYRYNSYEQLCTEFPRHLLNNGPRVLKKHSDSSGSGVWKVELTTDPKESKIQNGRVLSAETLRVRQAVRGSEDEIINLSDFLQSLQHYFENAGYLIDQDYQHQLHKGTIRCYMVRDVVAGFGYQNVNALLPTPENSKNAPVISSRNYFTAQTAEFQYLKKKMETQWLDDLLKTLDLTVDQLPILWDADFLPGPDSEPEALILCEINTSSVHPFPDSALTLIADELARTLINIYTDKD